MASNRGDIVFDSSTHGNLRVTYLSDGKDKKMQCQHFYEHKGKHVYTLTHTHTNKLYHDRIINKNHKGSFITTFKIPSS